MIVPTLSCLKSCIKPWLQEYLNILASFLMPSIALQLAFIYTLCGCGTVHVGNAALEIRIEEAPERLCLQLIQVKKICIRVQDVI